jgi:hypothetical protein
VTLAFVIAVLLAFGLLATTLWAIRFIATGPPDEPDLDHVGEVDVPYVCSVCGLSLTVTEAQGGDIAAPRHCREDMIPA